MIYSPLPPVDELRRLFDYDSVTGVIMWKVVGRGRRSDRSVGHFDKKGYLVIWTHGRFYRAHRIIWKMVYGQDPQEQVDHIDNNKKNNAILNLRLASHGENQKNSSVYKNNRCGLKGVTFHAKSKSWMARVQHNNVRVYKDGFRTKEEAFVAATEMRKELHGKFVRHE